MKEVEEGGGKEIGRNIGGEFGKRSAVEQLV